MPRHSARPLAALKDRARDYIAGDTDLSWTRLDRRGGRCSPPRWTSIRPRSSPFPSSLSETIRQPTYSLPGCSNQLKVRGDRQGQRRSWTYRAFG